MATLTLENHPSTIDRLLGPKNSFLRKTVEIVGVGAALFYLNTLAIPGILAEPSLGTKVLEGGLLAGIDLAGLNWISSRVRE